MKKAKVLSWVLLACMLFTLLAGCSDSSANKEGTGGDTAGETFEWNVNFTIPEASARHATAVMDKIAEESNGRLKFNYYYSNSLVQISEIPKALHDSVIDISLVPCSQFPSQLVYNGQLTSLPFLDFESGYELVEVYDAMYEQFPELKEELDNLGCVLFYCYSGDPYRIQWTFNDREIRTPADLDGLKIQVSDASISTLMAAHHAAPVSGGLADIYSNMEKGVVQGVVQRCSTTYNAGAAPLTKCTTMVPLLYDSSIMLISKASYEKLPADLQELFVKYRAEGSQSDTDRLTGEYDAFLENAPDDYTQVELTEDELELWRSETAEITQDKLKEMNDSGHEKVYEMYDFIVDYLQK